MSNVNAYDHAQAFGGWSRIDLLLAIYEKAIDGLTMASEALKAENKDDYAAHVLGAQKAILAIHAGLKPDEYEVAFNVARLLHFVLSCIENKEFDDAIKIMSELFAGFQAIHDEATSLELSGQIPKLQLNDELCMNV